MRRTAGSTTQALPPFHLWTERFAVVLLLAVLCGCSVGQTALQGDRLGYNQHLQASNNEELLINLVRMRYGEQPLFLQVGSISANFGMSARMGFGAEFQDGGGDPPMSTASPSLGYTYSENPTIIYTPVQGSDYASRMLSEIDYSTFLLLARGGWSMRLLTQLLAMRIGNLHNYTPYGVRAFDPEHNMNSFIELTDMLKELETKGNLEFVRIERPADRVENAVLRVRFASKEMADRMAELMNTSLQLKRGPRGGYISTLTLTPVNDFMRRTDGEVYFKLRNMQEVFWALSAGVDLPRKDTASGTALEPTDPRDLRPLRLIHVRTSSVRPASAYVSVRHAGQWFYVDGADLDSKLCLTALGSLYSLQAGTSQGAQPLLTLPVGRR